MNTFRVVLTILEPLSMSIAQASVHERKVRDGKRRVSECFTANPVVPRGYVSRNYI